MSTPPVSPLLVVYMYIMLFTLQHMDCYVKSFVFTPQDCPRLWIRSSMDSSTARSQAHFLFLFVSHMVCFYICLSLSPTNTDTYINTHSRICTRTHFPIYWKKTQTLASQSFEVPLFFLRFTVPCSHVRLTDKSETPANTVSSNLNVAILQSHFQLCFSGFIRGEIVQQLP